MRVTLNSGGMLRRLTERGMDATALAKEAHLAPGTVAAALKSRPLNLKSASRIAQALARTPVEPLLAELTGPTPSEFASPDAIAEHLQNPTDCAEQVQHPPLQPHDAFGVAS
jgi:hypothetical protein